MTISASTIDNILDLTKLYVSDIKPSAWYEKNMIMPIGSAFPGPFSYNTTPYWKEVVDCMAKDSPVRRIAVMKGAQTGCSASVLTPAVGYTIAENPGNILFLVGNDNLVEPAVTKLDHMIDNCGLRQKIKPSIMRAKNSKTGDTNRSKEFLGGTLLAGSATNHKMIRQLDVMVIIADDFEAVKQSSESDGDSRSLIDQRAAAYENKMKIYYVSTPGLKKKSNIEPAYMMGDQRKYFVPCPCCGDYINFEWVVPVKDKEGEMGGIIWELDENGVLIEGSVGYKCQSCGDVFDDSHKYDMNLHGEWRPTATAKEPGFRSYHLSSLYAPPGMKSWASYVRQYLEACPPNQPRNEEKYKAFCNLCLGICYEEMSEDLKANDLQTNNMRAYNVGDIPERMSEKDGNGKIVLLTCAADLNGKLEDARLDYEIVAWSENGSSYSVDHGSIGTFVFREYEKAVKQDREKFTYERNRVNSVWPEFIKVLSKEYTTDTGRKMKIAITGLDTGHCEEQAYDFIDNTTHLHIVGLKGDKENQFIKYGIVMPNFKIGKSRPNLFMVQVNQIKDDLATRLKFKWHDGEETQPVGYLNFPMSSNGKYQYSNFFSHYESEHRVIEMKDGNGIASRWVKKTSTAQNHMWDCRIYNMVIVDILLYKLFKEAGKKDGTWKDYVDMIMGRYKKQ